MKVPKTYYDEIFNFKGQWDMLSKCGLKIREFNGKMTVMVTELYQENPGTSVTYAGISLAMQICESKELNINEIVYIECSPDTNSKLSFYEEELFEVTFMQNGMPLAQPQYRKLSAEEVQQLSV